GEGLPQARPARLRVRGQWTDLRRRDPGDVLWPPRRGSSPRQALRSTGARQDGAFLAHAAGAMPRPLWRSGIAARRAGAAPGVARQALPCDCALVVAREDTR